MLSEVFDEGQVDLQELAGVFQELPRSHRVHVILHLRPSAHPLRDDLAPLQEDMLLKKERLVAVKSPQVEVRSVH